MNKLHDVCVRWLQRADLPAILRIERESFQCGWTEDTFRECFNQSAVAALVCDLNPALVNGATQRSQQSVVIGFLIYEIQEDRLVVMHCAVDPPYRRRGLGTAMIQALVNKLGGRRSRLSLEIRETNMAFIRFCRAIGFRATGINRGRFEDTGEDAYDFELAIPVPIDPKDAGWVAQVFPGAIR